MRHLWFRLRQCNNHRHAHLLRKFCSSPSKESSGISGNVRNLRNVPPTLPVVHTNCSITTGNTISSSSFRRSAIPLLALSATALSVAIASSYYPESGSAERPSNPLRYAVEDGICWAKDSFLRLFYHGRQTGAAAAVLWQSLRSVLSSANHEVRVGFELRVASLLADIAAANASRRSALVGAGGGKVVDWLLETVAEGVRGKDGRVTQAEAARALAYLVADPNVVPDVLGRPHAVPCLLRFIFSCQPKKKKLRRSSFDVSDSLKGRSMLVAAILDVVTGNCDSIEKISVKPFLSNVAETRDIAAAIEVIDEGGLHIENSSDDEDDDDDGKGGLKGLGIKILEGTTAIGLTRTGNLMDVDYSEQDEENHSRHTAKKFSLLRKNESSVAQKNLSSAIVPGLWDDLHCEHIAVPFAAWALANWAMASEVNRSRIQELDPHGRAVTNALLAPERSVKWHGSLVARVMLEDRNLSLNDSVVDWCYSLLTTISIATENDDISLAKVAFPGFLLCVERCPEARRMAVEKGLERMRETAKRTTNHNQIQDFLAKALLLVSEDDSHMSLVESQKWSSILLHWIFRKNSDNLRYSATKILTSILDDYGPACVPISQGWLSMILHEVLSHTKSSATKLQTKTEKNQVDQSNVAYATQTCSQLAGAAVNLAMNQHGEANDPAAFPLADLFQIEPLSVPYRSIKKDAIAKFDVADSAVATLKGIKALTEICADDAMLQEKISKLGVFILLRRLLLNDDYEKLAAIKAYDASRSMEVQAGSSNTEFEGNSRVNDSSAVRVPPTAHIRKHAARLLVVISGQPEVQKLISDDKVLCKWLEECAGGKIAGCTDPKLQSYCRAALLNASCSNNGLFVGRKCPQYRDAVLLINPERTHWKNQQHAIKDAATCNQEETAEISNFDAPYSDFPPFDVVFVHGLRGGPFKSWRLADDKASAMSSLVEKIDEEAGKLGTFWPGEWLSNEFPDARLFTLKYKTNLTQWSGATLPLQEVSSKLLDDVVAAGIGSRPVVFVTHSMGGLVVKQMLYKAREDNMNDLVNNTIGIVFYSCPHFGSKLADMPWRMGLVLRPAPTIGELRSGSPRLVELNNLIRQLNKKGSLDVLSFCETKVTPIVEGYGGWAVRMEIVPIESAYPGYGELVVLESTDHINSCKPVSRADPSYAQTLQFLRELRERYP